MTLENTPRERFRWAFNEQLRTRFWMTDLDPRMRNMVESGAMDAFDYAWRLYGLDKLNLHPRVEDD